ncbi:hypothetical protein H7U19_05175 [Hyunsoonleella sp. SJ7]|uniref:Uncharacterized protein n=1 Tax=Hyunsoonleella aquatilis TaxID=2762758 RepID=A0A923HE59_9FLAO|nr:hypothetical protein [Hyunsoonleella aquatilis]MBC3757785.1 hypothetical protein [Hyunsoonleella aquatilis]
MRIFKEEQRFTQTWLIILLVVFSIVPLVLIYRAFLDQKMNIINFTIATTLIMAGNGLIFLFKLKTRIDDIGIHYQFFPFHLKMKIIPWKTIKSAETRTYDALSEYGGWGLKGGLFWKREKGIAVNVSGNIGIQLTLVDNKKILIGTRRRSDVDVILAKYSNKT